MKKLLLLGSVLYSLQSISQVRPDPVAPATLNVGGGTGAINPNFIVDWSIGESTIIETFEGKNSSANYVVGINWNVTSGVLQPFNKDQVYNFLMPLWNSEEVHVYPIPTTGMVFLDFKEISPGKLSIQLFTANGRLLGIKDVDQLTGNGKQQWNLSNQPGGIYYFRIQLDSDQGIILKQGTFKIIKK
jgi:type IX secretion system substrate protein